jgi:ABC-type transport system involved in multi-copper enzyme maturation permease subunit
MIGSLVYLELLRDNRRGRQYLFRWLYAGWLILQLLGCYVLYRARWIASTLETGRPNTNTTGDFASDFVQLFVVQQFILLLLVTPAFTAGAITDEKSRGTLQYLISADVSARDIILGKLLGRIALVGQLALAGLPVLCFIGVFGGLQPGLLLAVLATTVVPLFALGAASLLASVWSRQTRDAVLGLYAVGGAGLLLIWGIRELPAHLGGQPGGLSWLSGMFQAFNPLYVLEPAWGDNDLGLVYWRLLASMAAWGSVGLLCVGLAIGRLRATYLRQLEGSGKPRQTRWWHAPSVGVSDEPIRWKESHIEGVAPLVVLRRLPRWLGVSLVAGLTLCNSLAILWASRPPGLTLADVASRLSQLDVRGLEAIVAASLPSGEGFLVQGVVVLLLASLVVGIRCSGAVSGERERQTWEPLLLTPLEPRTLIRDKLWGILGASVPYLLAYAVPALALAPLGGLLAVLWTVLWLGATVLAMYFVGAAGLWCSVRATSSWKSLLGTVGLGYVGGYLVCGVMTSFLIPFVAFVVWVVLQIVDALYGMTSVRAVGGFANIFNTLSIAACLGLAASFYIGARYFLLPSAEKWIADRDRIRHWADDPFARPYRRAPVTQAPRPQPVSQRGHGRQHGR